MKQCCAGQKFLDNAIGNLTIIAVPKSENLTILHIGELADFTIFLISVVESSNNAIFYYRSLKI